MDPAIALRRAAASYAREEARLDRELKAARIALTELESQHEALQRRRDDAIREAVDAGLSPHEISKVTGLSHDRVQQIIPDAR
jgi:hypothetical protein